MKTIGWLALAAAFTTAQAAPRDRVVAVNIDGIVHPITVEILSRAIDEAGRTGASAVLIRLDTPGGLMEAMRECIQKIVTSPVPVITYVEPSGGRAASAGFFLLQAGDVAAMAPGTNTGAATPVSLFGGQMDADMRKKVLNDAAASLRSLTEKRSRNSELAEKTVMEAKSFTDGEALTNRLIELVATNEADLFRKLDGREVTRFDGRKQTLHLANPEVIEYDKSVREKIVSAIADPNLAIILVILGAIGIYVEFHSPGLIVPGVLGAILVVVGLFALSVLPINWGAAALIVMAFALFVLEAKFNTHGLLTIGGTVTLILGVMLLISSPFPELRIRLSTALAVALPFALVTSFILMLAVRARRNKVLTGSSGMVGEIGTVHTPLAPRGKIFIHGEFWDAVSSVPVEPGAKVKVKQVDGLTLQVEPASADKGVAHE